LATVSAACLEAPTALARAASTAAGPGLGSGKASGLRWAAVLAQEKARGRGWASAGWSVGKWEAGKAEAKAAARVVQLGQKRDLWRVLG